ncbi:MAG: hypothetical protein ACXW52_10970 [Candidatus Binatia bacterium]
MLQASFEFFKDQFPQTLRVDERSYANLLRYLDHPKAAAADPKEFFDNRLLNDILRYRHQVASLSGPAIRVRSQS